MRGYLTQSITWIMADLNSNLSNEHVIYHQDYKFGKENNLGSFSKAV